MKTKIRGTFKTGSGNNEKQNRSRKVKREMKEVRKSKWYELENKKNQHHKKNRGTLKIGSGNNEKENRCRKGKLGGKKRGKKCMKKR